MVEGTEGSEPTVELPGSLEWSPVPPTPANWSAKANRGTSGLYVAILGARVLYVGQAKHVFERVSGHRLSPWLRLLAQEIGEPKFFWAAVDRERMNELERQIIAELRPEANSVANGYRARPDVKARWSQKRRAEG